MVEVPARSRTAKSAGPGSAPEMTANASCRFRTPNVSTRFNEARSQLGSDARGALSPRKRPCRCATKFRGLPVPRQLPVAAYHEIS
jgi:hypothetical protein